MQVLNLINEEKSDIKYTLTRFPDGEIQITLGEFSRKDTVKVRCRITDAEELFILMQVNDILTRQAVVWDLHIAYLMGMRMDRVMDFNRPFTLSVVAEIIKNFSCTHISVREPHSDRTIQLLGEKAEGLFPEYTLNPDSQVVFPDRGAYLRYGHMFPDKKCIVCDKVRELETGRILSIKIANPEDIGDKPLVVIDDLCDAGGTFVGIASELRKYTDKELIISVTHMVNRKGIENLSKAYNHVYFTNSYKNWDNLPENVTQIDVI